MIQLFQNLFNKEQLNFPALFKRDALIIDVRTTAEFAKRHPDGSVNMPLSDIQNHIEVIKQQELPVITCCRSGMRSGSAAAILKKAGVEVYNGGSWDKVQAELDSYKKFS